MYILSITVNNCAHQAKSEVKVAYQPFQTISRHNLKDETIKKLADKTVRYIEDAKTNPEAALRLMGIEIDSEDMEDKMEDVEMNVFHAAILKYPQLLNDIHVQKTMKSVLLSERRKAQGCKLVLDGFWSYICPDLYAFCQWLFLGQDIPEGLVTEGYIYNHYYDGKEIEEICCLRYPHLSDCEHGIRKVLQSKECEEWFSGTDTIVSSHDLISKVLQADWDGDHICLVHDKAFMDVLDRDQYPLFYNMTKAEPAQITNKAIMTSEILHKVAEEWKSYDKEQKEDISKLIMDTKWEIFAELMGAYHILKDENERKHKEIMKLLDEKKADLEEKYNKISKELELSNTIKDACTAIFMTEKIKDACAAFYNEGRK